MIYSILHSLLVIVTFMKDVEEVVSAKSLSLPIINAISINKSGSGSLRAPVDLENKYKSRDIVFIFNSAYILLHDTFKHS